MAPPALTSATRRAAFLVSLVVLLVGVAGFASPAHAAKKPCWERVIDDWLDNGRIDAVYGTRCIEEARQHLPEDIRAYSDIEEKLDAALVEGARATQGTGGGTTTTQEEQPLTPAEAKELTRKVGDEEPSEGPIKDVLAAAGPTSADSVPLPLIILAALALLLITAGAAGVAQRKLATRRVRRN